MIDPLQYMNTSPSSLPYYRPRPLIYMKGGSVFHSGETYPARVVLKKDMISVGCSDISVEAAQYILDEHRKAFPPKADREVVLQDGNQYLKES